MAYEDPQLVHEDKWLTEISVAYEQEAEFVGQRLFPTVGVEKQSDKYRVYNKDNAARVTQDFRAPGSRANELPPMMPFGKDAYFAEEHALKDKVPVEEQQNADAELADPLEDATNRLTDTILLNREYSIIQLATTAANYASGHSVTLSGTAQWNDYTNSDPITDIKMGRLAMRTSMFREANTVIMGWEVAWQLEDHPKFLDRMKTTPLAMTTDEVIARVLRIPKYVTAQAQYNTAAYNAAANMVDLWGRDVLLAWVPDSPGKKTPAYGYEFAWAYPSGNRMPTERWYDEDIVSDWVRVRRRYDLKFIAVDATGKSIGGYLIKDAVA